MNRPNDLVSKSERTLLTALLLSAPGPEAILFANSVRTVREKTEKRVGHLHPAVNGFYGLSKFFYGALFGMLADIPKEIYIF